MNRGRGEKPEPDKKGTTESEGHKAMPVATQTTAAATTDDDRGDKVRRQYEKIMLFVIGWFTVPFLTGGIWYDLFGGLDAGEIWQRLTHPRELIDVLGVYTIAFALFGYLPAKISKAGWGKRIFYFILFYFLLCRMVDFIF